MKLKLDLESNYKHHNEELNEEFNDILKIGNFILKSENVKEMVYKKKQFNYYNLHNIYSYLLETIYYIIRHFLSMKEYNNDNYINIIFDIANLCIVNFLTILIDNYDNDIKQVSHYYGETNFFLLNLEYKDDLLQHLEEKLNDIVIKTIKKSSMAVKIKDEVNKIKKSRIAFASLITLASVYGAFKINRYLFSEKSKKIIKNNLAIQYSFYEKNKR